MKPILFDGANILGKPPADYNPETAPYVIGDLPIMDKDGYLTSIWKPSFEELKILNDGGGISVGVRQRSLPVFHVGVVHIDYPAEPSKDDAKDVGGAPTAS